MFRQREQTGEGNAATLTRHRQRRKPATPVSGFLLRQGYGGQGGGRYGMIRPLTLPVRTSNPSFLGGNYAYVSYLTISDAVAATGYDQATGLTTLSSEGAKPMTYNGVRYSEANVYNGSYTLWSFQQFYTAVSPTGAETQFQTDLKAAIDTSLTPATGLRTSLLQVQRTGGDGGPVAP